MLSNVSLIFQLKREPPRGDLTGSLPVLRHPLSCVADHMLCLSVQRKMNQRVKEREPRSQQASHVSQSSSGPTPVSTTENMKRNYFNAVVFKISLDYFAEAEGDGF